MVFPTIVMFLPSLEGGGAERVFARLANEFVALGYPVHLALARAAGPYLSELSDRVRVVDFRAASVIRSLPALRRHLRAERPGVVLSALDHANVTAILARAVAGTGTRCVVSARAVRTAIYRRDMTARRWITQQVGRLVYGFADQIIANSHFVANDYAQSLGIPAQQVSVIYNPLDLAAIEERSRAVVEHPWFAEGSPPVVLSVGSLTPVKDFAMLIRAFAVVRSTRPSRLVILGEGPQRASLESLVRELRLQDDVHLPGFVDNPFAWMRRAAVFVSSSLTEGCPNALMEALACGAPVVSTNGPGGSAELLQGGVWGRLVPVGDVAAMAAAIVATLDSPTHPDGRRRAADFDMNGIACQYLRTLLPNHSSQLAGS